MTLFKHRPVDKALLSPGERERESGRKGGRERERERERDIARS
jgi:hypothetical protein